MRFLSIIYLFLFLYIIAAITFWGHELNKQNNRVYHYELKQLQTKVDSIDQYELFRAKKKLLVQGLNARRRQYTGEGVTFLLVILIGAGIVYSTIKSRNHLARQQSNFILSITHELKSPIASVKLNLQTLQHRKKLPEDTRATLINRSVIEANRLDDLCNNLLLASKMEDRHFEFSRERINFTNLVEEAVSIMRERTKEDFDTRLDKNCYTNGDALLWRLVISNLLENSVKYGNSETPIVLELKQSDENLNLLIKDQGIGIPDEEKTKIFNKFYRVGNENARKTKGTGLGLFLTAEIIHRFEGSISVGDNQPRGSIFEITLPSV